MTARAGLCTRVAEAWPYRASLSEADAPQRALVGGEQPARCARMNGSAPNIRSHSHSEPGQHRAHKPALDLKPSWPAPEKLSDAAGHDDNQRIDRNADSDLRRAQRQ